MRRRRINTLSARGISRHAFFILSVVALTMAITIASLAGAGCGEDIGPTENRDNSFTVSGSPTLIASTENGSIDVNTGADGEVRVQAELVGVNKIEYEVSQDGDVITVNAEIEGSWSNVRTNLTITVPTKTDVELETSNGSVELEGVEGSGSLETSNGKIALENAKGDFRLRSSNGKLEMQDVTGEVDADTSNGSISYNGEITAGGDNRLISSNGSIDVVLQGTPSVSLDASTSNGNIDCDLEISATTTGDKHLVGTIGDGEADLRIQTSNGDVSIS
jgi:DUF4097 and DUF4098 domain-containing protein YvlB